jgi:hypothetical protein
MALARRYFLRAGVLATAASGRWPFVANADWTAPELAKVIESLEPYFTPQEKFRDVSRGKPLPHSLPDEKKTEVGLTRETWKLEVISDPENPAKLGKPMTKMNDTYASGNNDVDSPLKSFAATLSVPKEVKAGEPIPITGYAQVGISGLSKVQVWIQSNAQEWPSGDKYFATAPWTDAQILAPPKRWGGVPDGNVLSDTLGFDPATGQPRTWPMRLAKVHWATLLPSLTAGEYTFRCRTIDEKGIAQPLPRPFRKSGHSVIESVSINVTS